MPTRSIPTSIEYSPQKHLHHELALFGFPLRCHPLELFKDVFATWGQYVGKEVTLIGCGMWMGEVNSLQWSQVNWTEGKLLPEGTGYQDGHSPRPLSHGRLTTSLDGLDAAV
jgi:hypothetical protein